jgi:hypothetical protein
MSEDHISEFVKSQPPEWLAGVQIADLLLLHLSRPTATKAQRSGASILLTAMALQRAEGFHLGLVSAQGALLAARTQEPDADAARLVELYTEFRDMARGDTPTLYHTMLKGMVMRDVTPAPELAELFEAFDRAFTLLIQPATVNALLDTRPIVEEETP